MRRRRAALLALLALGCALACVGALSVLGGPRAAAQTGSGEPVAQTDDSVPATHVTMIGSSPKEATNETWGVGQSENGSAVLVRYAAGNGWTLGPGLLDAAGEALEGFKLYQPTSTGPSPLSGQVTPAGSAVLAGTVPAAGGKTREVLLVRKPGGSFQETGPIPDEGAEVLLKPSETLFASGHAPVIAALDEAEGRAGALVVPVGGGEVEDAVLHWNGSKWTSEPIEVPASSSSEFHVVGIGATSPTNAWLVAQLSSGGFALFRRVQGTGETPTWQPVAPEPGAKAGEPLTVPVGGGTVEPFGISGAPDVLSQALTVTEEGVWVDGERTDAHVSTTIYYKLASHEESAPASVTSWCVRPGSAVACENELPETLPLGAMRSFAWANGSTPYGERVITGFANGVSFRLEGSSFTRVLALGASAAPNDVGGTYGAAFSNAREGWLGQEGLPVHITLEPAPSRLTPWPVSFRHALLAVVPQPEAPIGALSSEALAVGDRGEVARYKPGQGWLPESLLNSSGRHVTPILRAVAWPTPSRAYAVGNEGQMWLWRQETGLWEQDPATPFNFRANLLGIAFDPTNPDRGYAVGQEGTLLGYGKTWTQEPLPPQVAGASFTSIAFAGSEAIVAYRKLPDPSKNVYTGGLLVNEGSGWRVEEGAAAVDGQNVPEVVAGLPDGGAAFAASGVEPAKVYERSGPGSAWEATPQPLPGGREPGSLALFREGGALRVVASGTALNTYSVENESPSPPGAPPLLVKPYPLESNPESGVLRQTSSGWSDEQHELNNAQEPPGHYLHWDTPYQPDPISAVLIDPTGSQGWAVGGFIESRNPETLDTADIDRYPSDGTTPVGVGGSSIPTSVAEDPTFSGDATFAIGGDSQCAAPCVDRANAGLGADVWLSAALARAGQISGIRAFLYTGPHVTAGETSGPASFTIPYAREYDRYAQILEGAPLPTYAVATPTDLAGGAGESLFEEAFSGALAPFGGTTPGVGDPTPAPASAPERQCGAHSGCYYAFNSSGATGQVRVVVLDNTADVSGEQLEWVARELGEAKEAGEPAIAVGNANLNTQINAGDPAAEELARVLVAPCPSSNQCVDRGAGASAYFFDAPEENVALALHSGGESIPTFGSGTLGYVNYEKETAGDFLGASGFMLAQVNLASYHAPSGLSPNRAEVTVRLIPNIGELGLEAEDGTLLRRSQAALFQALARRPRAGNRSRSGAVELETDPYIPIPSNCVGTTCVNGLFPEYTFTSSRPDIGDFVEPNLDSPESRAVLLGSNGKPIHDSQSGLFCAYNAGTTTVTISAGGLSYSLPVTVQAGSVRQPCGTTPLSELTAAGSAPATPPAPAPAPAPAGPAPAASPAPVPVPAPPATPAPPTPSSPPAARPPAAKAFFLPTPLQPPLLAFVPPPVPTPARPSPPTGTSAVTSPVEAVEKEEEQEEATESVSNQAVAYRSSEHDPAPEYVIGMLVIAALAGVSIRRRTRGRRGRARVATATVSAMQAREKPERRRRH